MFTFLRSSSGSAEVWAVVVAEGVLPDAEKRLGPASRHNARQGDEGPSHFHDVGTLCVIQRGEEMEFLLGCKQGLSEAEKRTLFVELEMLLGQEVYAYGAEEKQGWFLHDRLRPHRPDITATSSPSPPGPKGTGRRKGKSSSRRPVAKRVKG